MTDYKDLLIFTAAYLISYIAGGAGISALSALSLIGVAVFFYLREYKRTCELLNLRGLMALGLIGGEGVARLQLSNLSTYWTTSTWLSFYTFYILFYVISGKFETFLDARSRQDIHITNSDDISDKNSDSNTTETHTSFNNRNSSKAVSKRSDYVMLYRIIILSVITLSYTAFIYEAIKLQFIPLFTVDTPHAYSYFHLKGIHYFTTLAVLVPGISMLYLEHRKSLNLKPDIISILGLALPLILSVLLVSRFQFMFAAILAIFVSGVSGRRYKLWQILTIFIFLISVYVVITIERAHSVTYLNGIFEMKNPDTPIFITQPYMYIANNYDNFNVMTQSLTLHSKGLRMLYPFLTLTGLKFFDASLAVGFPLFTTKPELTTVTLLYDAWYDFGILGIIIFAIIIGLITGFILYEHERDNNPFAKLIYAELAFYFSVSFFTTWFSNPATWFYLGFSVIFYIIHMVYSIY